MPERDALFDYIVVGAGAAGCAVAARLSEKSDTRVLLLEAGGADRSLFFRVPALGFMVTAAERYNWHFETEPNEVLNGRRLKVHSGRVLGGSSSINGMQYARGNPHDYDAWNVEG